MKKIITTEVSFTEKEVQVIKKCLLYCRHRLEKHPDAGIHLALNKDKSIVYQIVENL